MTYINFMEYPPPPPPPKKKKKKKKTFNNFCSLLKFKEDLG